MIPGKYFLASDPIEINTGDRRAATRSLERRRLAVQAPFTVVPIMTKSPLRTGIGGPVGSGKTALVDSLCKSMRERYRLGVITNDIFAREDMECLVRSQALPDDRIIGVQTGGCPHTAIREDASINFDALDELSKRHPDLEIVFLESGGDNVAASVPRWFPRVPGTPSHFNRIRWISRGLGLRPMLRTWEPP